MVCEERAKDELRPYRKKKKKCGEEKCCTSLFCLDDLLSAMLPTSVCLLLFQRA